MLLFFCCGLHEVPHECIQLLPARARWRHTVLCCVLAVQSVWNGMWIFQTWGFLYFFSQSMRASPSMAAQMSTYCHLPAVSLPAQFKLQQQSPETQTDSTETKSKSLWWTSMFQMLMLLQRSSEFWNDASHTSSTLQQSRATQSNLAFCSLFMVIIIC